MIKGSGKFLCGSLAILSGVPYTLGFSILAFIGGFFLGLTIATIRYTRKYFDEKKNRFNLGVFLKIFSSFLRSTPIIFQIYLFLYVIPRIFNSTITIVIVLILNSSAYFSEIFFNAFCSIPKIQIEIAKSLKFSNYQIMKYIIIDQILETEQILIRNELSALAKETAILGYAGIHDIMFQAKFVSRKTFDFLFPIIFVGILYYIINIFYENIVSKYILKCCRFIIKRI